jgi:hypothetical protein
VEQEQEAQVSEAEEELVPTEAEEEEKEALVLRNTLVFTELLLYPLDYTPLT